MKRSLKTKKISELIKDVLKPNRDHISSSNLSFPDLWTKIVGKQVAAETKKIRFYNNTLHISILNPYLKRDLMYQKPQIIQRIQELNSSISKIVFD
tara:strand:+ start:188 stop:475 length:288 start_codon:yes stop_codon:yes gene_type:complete